MRPPRLGSRNTVPKSADCAVRRLVALCSDGWQNEIPYFLAAFQLSKLILLALVGFLVYRILKSYQKSLSQREKTPETKGNEDMVRCAQCGVNLPKSDSVASRGEFFCSDEHRKLHQK